MVGLVGSALLLEWIANVKEQKTLYGQETVKHALLIVRDAKLHVLPTL